MIRLRALVVVSTCLAASAAHGQSAKPDLHTHLLGLAMNHIEKAQCGSAKCTPATEQERTAPPLSNDQARAIVQAATISTMAEHCGLDWQRRNFAPLMRHHRDSLRMGERQMALVGLLHGLTMSMTEAQVKAQPCTSDLRATVDQRLIAQ
jgi:hypothetical protein